MSTLNVLLLGSGGREHAIAWRLAQSSRLAKLWIAPGNGGTSDFGENVEVHATDIEGVLALAQRTRADLVIVGPEDPLAAGIADRLTAEGVPVFGPTRAASEIEWSKTFAKDLMSGAGIPTADAHAFSDAAEAKHYVEALRGPCVVKADGLAAGKGVTVCDSSEQAVAAIEEAMSARAFGDAGASIVIEERMTGPETSAHAFTDGATVRHMPFSCDHKPVFDGNLGPNTGGMGVYSPPGWLTSDVSRRIEAEVTERAVRALAEAGRTYRGVLYPGMMLTPGGPRVVEFNARFGDPETQVVLPRLVDPLSELLLSAASGHLEDHPAPAFAEAVALTVILASEGYPAAPVTGRAITGLDAAASVPGVHLAHSATAEGPDGDLVTTGGRVLSVVALGSTFAEASARAYEAIGHLELEGAQHRTDIGARVRES